MQRRPRLTDRFDRGAHRHENTASPREGCTGLLGRTFSQYGPCSIHHVANHVTAYASSARSGAAAAALIVMVVSGCTGAGSSNLRQSSPTPAQSPEFAFTAPANLGPTMNSMGFDGGPSISADGLSLYFISDRPLAVTGGDIWVATRRTSAEPFGNPQRLGPTVNGAGDEGGPDISTDGLELFFDRDDGYLYVSARTNTSQPFGQPRKLSVGGHPDISADGLDLYFSSSQMESMGGTDLWVLSRPGRAAPFGPPVNLGPTVNTQVNDGEPSISNDGLALFFASDRSPGSGNLDLWVTIRASRSDPFHKPRNLGPTVNSFFNDDTPEISTNGKTLFFMSNRPGGSGFFDLYEVRRVDRR